ncbi:MAG: twin-arginine translocation signal domain-containing protein, partial [Actinobacteria bacterium]|nr:twin-arginine translocation signal domain-containing protein [Actinomycetota bacterium]
MSDVNNGISRRSVLKGAAIGGAGLVAGGSLLAGCGKKKVTGDVHYTIRGNLSDAGAKINIAVNDAYTKKTGNKVISQAVNSDDFQNNFVQIMQGTPDDA